MIEIKYKLEKVLIGIISLLVLFVMVLGIKIGDNKRKMKELKDDLEAGLPSVDISKIQKSASDSREGILDKIANSPEKQITEVVEETKITPGQTVKQIQTVSAPQSKSTKTKTS